MLRSTFARLTFLIAAVLFVVVGASLFLFSRFGLEERMRYSAEFLAERAERIVEVFADQGPDAARALLRGRDRHRFRIESRTPPGPGRPPPRFMVPAIEELAEALGTGSRFRLYGPGRGELWATSPKFRGYWLVVRMRGELRRPPGAFIGWIALVAGIVFIGAYLFTRYLTRPLVRLSEATKYIARGEALPPLPERGPAEVRRLTRALRDASEAARRATRDRELMLAGISHDLRTPLARLRVAAELLPSDGQGLRDGMVQDVEELDAIVGQFMAYVRDGSDESPRPSRLDELVRAAVGPLQRSGSPVDLVLADVPSLELRPLAIQRLITNLVQNALNHGHPPVCVTCGIREGAVFLAVRDHGEGVDPEHFAELLRPFSRGDKARTSLGSGLGLSIVTRIARLHGAEVSAGQDPEGFEVSVVFPAGVGQ